MQGYRDPNLVPCQRCGRMSAPSECFYDLAGLQVCRFCHGNQQAAVAGAQIAEAQMEQRRSGWSTGRWIWVAVVVTLALIRACVRFN